MMMRAFMKRYSADKFLQRVFKLLNVNPEDFERSEEELAQLPQEFAEVQAIFAQQQGGGGGRGGSAAGTFSSPTGEPGLQSEVNEQASTPSA